MIRRRSGSMLVEWLMGMALAGVVLGLAASLLQTTRGPLRALDARMAEAQRGVAVPQLVSLLVAGAGRGMQGCSFELLDAGRHLRWRTTPLGQATPVTLELFAGLDGARRPALYQRQPPSARQPWLEEVVGFTVEGLIDADGAGLSAAAVGARVHALHIRLDWEDGGRSGFISPLPHTPCLGWVHE
jgi:hypothetical protein